MTRSHDDLPGSLVSVPPLPELETYLVRALRHELVQPLHSLTLMLDLLPQGGSEAELAQWARRLSRAVDGMKRMVGGLGEMARLDLAPPAQSIAMTSLGTLFCSLADAKAVQARDRAIRIRSAASTLRVSVDRALLRIGLDPLLENAVRHSRSSKILLGARRMRGGLLVGVWDQGDGIPEDEVVTCLDVLGTGSAARRNGSAGLGLGLPIARRAADLMGCQFYFRTQPGRGLTAGFILTAD